METITLSHNQFLDKYLRTAQDTDWSNGYQCVDLAKLYSSEVLWVPLGSFGGTARKWWENKSKTFDPKKWDRIPYTVGFVPLRWDIIFYDKPWLTWHVAIVHEANKLDIIVIEENWATWNGDGKGYNQVNLETKRDYKSVLGVYRKK